ncbi:putative signal transduction protein with Nacht domain (plasmid) [Anabaenopsis circularis NIES-21]|uniref:Putative signal transduction protein with Nacht domain n=1 Tax=Anabaenopsis circularis NIES-21 TaxID=1085406 RepID=A0A1Z4GRJ0_9CYAN|nr:putative signal transduction protein with Nacht domain [Anabaenopsis circularis NIES-21]
MSNSSNKAYQQNHNQGQINNADIIIIYKNADSGESQELISINLRELCDATLKSQQKNQEFRHRATEKGSEIHVYVPLGLVERKEQPRRDLHTTVQHREVYQLEKEVISHIYEHDEFLQQVIGQTSTGGNKHIAIIGEPGAGKTTLLGAIASFILNRNTNSCPSSQAVKGENNKENLAIFIPLARLGGKTLENYLLETWLSEAMALVYPEVIITQKIKEQLENQLKQRFQKGVVWLLLDGVDEMSSDSSTKLLNTFKQQLTLWLTQARIVLTCRLNVWDAQVKNPLGEFNTYKTQDFKPEDIDKFIQEWFACASVSERGEQLQAKLREPGREVIYELVKNPLRLSLLCQIFYIDKQAELPKTKAGLYQKFIRYFYEWKTNDIENKQELHSALAKLALEGMENVSRFSLSEQFAKDKMGEDLFKLACDLGWLNLVNRDTETDEAVYAFFHTTFQEYFAACAISDAEFFLPQPKDINETVKYKRYRVFEPQWKEVILLWLGLENQKTKPLEEISSIDDIEKVMKKWEREDIIFNLMLFRDGTCELYSYKALFLLAAGIVEFREHVSVKDIVNQVVQFLGHYVFREEAKKALEQTDRAEAINALVDLIYQSKDERASLQAIEILGNIGKNSPKAIATLVDLIDNPQDENFQRIAAESLGKIDKNNAKAIETLVDLIDKAQDQQFWSQAAESLAKIDRNNKKAIQVLVIYLIISYGYEEQIYHFIALDILEEIGNDNPEVIAVLLDFINGYQEDKNFSQPPIKDKDFYKPVIKILPKIVKKNPEVIAVLVNLMNNSPNKYIRKLAISGLGKMGKNNSEVISELVNLINNYKNEDILKLERESLEEFSKDNSEASVKLDEIIDSLDNKSIRQEAVQSLGEIGKDNPEVIATLIKLIDNSQNEDIYEQAAQSLGEIGKDNPEVIATLIKLIDNSQNEDICWQAAYSLGRIDKGNPKAIDTLINLIDKSQKPETRRLRAYQLGAIDQNNAKAINTLTELIDDKSQHEAIHLLAAYSLGEINPGNSKAIITLINLIEKSQHGSISSTASHYLGEIAKNHLTAITALVELIDKTQNENIIQKAAKALGEIGQDNSKAISALIKLIDTSQDELTDIGLQAIRSLEKIGKNNSETIAGLAPLITKVQDSSTYWYWTLVGILWKCIENTPYPIYYEAWQQGVKINLSQKTPEKKSLLRKFFGF